MKREYKTPKAKLVDFTYSEQVTAASKCIHYNLWSLNNPTVELCQDNLRDIPVKARGNCVMVLQEDV